MESLRQSCFLKACIFEQTYSRLWLQVISVFHQGHLEAVNVPKAVEYVLSCMNFDGGFGCRPGSESHSGQVVQLSLILHYFRYLPHTKYIYIYSYVTIDIFAKGTFQSQWSQNFQIIIQLFKIQWEWVRGEDLSHITEMELNSEQLRNKWIELQTGLSKSVTTGFQLQHRNLLVTPPPYARMGYLSALNKLWMKLDLMFGQHILYSKNLNEG